MQNLFSLMDNANNSIKNGQEIDNYTIEKLKKIINNKCIGIAQINTNSGNLEFNSKKIAKYIKFAESIGLEAVIFPELSLLGYPLQDTISRFPNLIKEAKKWLNGLARLAENTVVFVGFPEFYKNNLYYNSIAVLHHRVIKGVFRKNIISFSSRINDEKYQVPSSERGFISYDNSLTDAALYNKYNIFVGTDSLNKVDDNNSLISIVCAANSYKANRELFKHKNLSNVAKNSSKPLLYVNQVGVNDNIMFDGISCAYNSKGELIARAKAFEEQLLIVNPYDDIGKVYELPMEQEHYMSERNEFSLDYDYDLERTYNALVLGVKDYFKKCGFKRAVLGLSGGLDSTVCAVIVADAIGKENVYGVSMPSHITSSESKSDAEQLANNLGIHFTEAPIRSMIDTTTECFNELFSKVEHDWNDRYKKSFTPDNIQARSRAMILWGISNEFPSCIPIATSDKSEAYMGYATINGDMSGGFAPIADVTKTKLFALARWLNKNRNQKNVIPESVIQKRPGAELAIDPKTGKPLIAEDALMPYEFLDEIIWRIENKHESYEDMLKSKFVYERANSVSLEQKEEWLRKFYKRMSTAFYKWSIMPPFVAIEPHSINKFDYVQPITSSGINYIEVSEEYINECLA